MAVFARAWLSLFGARPGRARAVVALVACALVACSKGAPDVAPLLPLLREDGQLVELLTEAEELARGGNTTNAARNLREVVVPRARANWEASGRVSVRHPRAEALRVRIARAASDRLDATEQLAALFTAGDPTQIPRVLRLMDQVDRSVNQLEADVQQARTQPPERGCAAR